MTLGPCVIPRTLIINIYNEDKNYDTDNVYNKQKR